MNHSGEAKMIVALRSILPAVMLACIGAGQTAAQPVCKPALTVKQVGFSEMINLRRAWAPSLRVHSPPCTATSGLYSVCFIPLYQKAPEPAFTQPLLLRQREKAAVV